MRPKEAVVVSSGYIASLMGRTFFSGLVSISDTHFRQQNKTELLVQVRIFTENGQMDAFIC